MVRYLASFIGSLCTLLFMVVECQNENPRQNAEFNVNYDNTNLFLSCDTNYVLIDVTVLAGAGAFSDKCDKEVYGKSAEMLPADNNCYWKQNCTIKLPTDIMIVCYNIITNNNKTSVVSSEHSSEHCDCTWIMPEFLRPIHAKCIKAQDEAILLDICKGDADSLVERTAEQGLSGIVRSHSFYPWDYTDTARTCILKFPWPFDSALKVHQKLIVCIQDFDLSEGDSLSIAALGPNGVEAKTIVIHSKNYAEKYAGKNIEFEDEKNTFLQAYFNFTVGTKSVRGKGFVVCFKFTDTDDNEDKVTNNACANFVRDGNIANVEPASESEVGLLQTTATPIKTTSTVNVVVKTTTVLKTRYSKKKDVKSQQQCSKRFHSQQRGRKKKDKKIKKDKKDKTKRKKDKKENRTRRHNKAS